MSTVTFRGAAGVLLFLLVFTLPVAAAPEPAAATLTGEVVAVDVRDDSLRVRTPDGVEQSVRLAPGADIRREGVDATLPALRPVAPGFCHEVRVWLAGDGRAVAVEGFYPGCEAQVVATGWGTLTLRGLDGRTWVATLTRGCRVFSSGGWAEPAVLRPGQWVYVLCDLEGRAKNISGSD